MDVNTASVVSAAVGAFMAVLALDFIAHKAEVKLLSEGMSNVKITRF